MRSTSHCTNTHQVPVTVGVTGVRDVNQLLLDSHELPTDDTYSIVNYCYLQMEMRIKVFFNGLAAIGAV